MHFESFEFCFTRDMWISTIFGTQTFHHGFYNRVLRARIIMPVTLYDLGYDVHFIQVHGHACTVDWRTHVVIEISPWDCLTVDSRDHEIEISLSWLRIEKFPNISRHSVIVTYNFRVSKKIKITPTMQLEILKLKFQFFILQLRY